jgi:hypothetical protein
MQNGNNKEKEIMGEQRIKKTKEERNKREEERKGEKYTEKLKKEGRRVERKPKLRIAQ